MSKKTKPCFWKAGLGLFAPSLQPGAEPTVSVGTVNNIVSADLVDIDLGQFFK